MYELHSTQGFQKDKLKINFAEWAFGFVSTRYFSSENILVQNKNIRQRYNLILRRTRRNTNFNRTDDKFNKYNLPRAFSGFNIPDCFVHGKLSLVSWEWRLGSLN